MAMPQNYQDLQTFLLNFTGSNAGNSADAIAEIQQCIALAEVRMRLIELPALRTNPDTPNSPDFLTISGDGFTAPIPTDMVKPIFFYQLKPPPGTVAPTQGSNAPWIVYDRVSDREEIIRRQIDQLFLKPYGILRILRGKFSEIGQNYSFTPAPGAGSVISAYYYRAWPFLDAGDNTTNVVLMSFPEGYIYYSLAEYYAKRNNIEQAQKWEQKAIDAQKRVEDQNFKGKWAGGDLQLTSNFQPRQPRYSYR